MGRLEEATLSSFLRNGVCFSQWTAPSLNSLEIGRANVLSVGTIAEGQGRPMPVVSRQQP